VVAAIEAPITLLEKPIKVLLFDAVEPAHVALGLVPKVLDSIDVIPLISEEPRVVDAAVVEGAHVKGIVGSEGIGVNDAVRFDPLLDDGQERLGFCIGNNSRENLPTPFKKAKNGDFARGATASLAFANTSK
jgi:hypothetical protein